MRSSLRRNAAVSGVAFAFTWACLSLTALTTSAVSRADEVCPAGMYWDIYAEQCLYYDLDVYIDPDPIVGPVGPIGVGGVGPVAGPVGPVGVGGPGGPVGPIGGPGRR
jgi:hypothetical protein